ncbi:sulfite exporter TauE/SafE family protein [Williamsia sp. CHRR-6]|uniref:sulfite exporter TauE/SafE family protein n=1 Tax=Williamsia sp. CHRR-6 TaxID=2835871 RepID=UPI001BD94808|nr:sulfite exporter TauE/SafE family protein [Williamsia sp. CHRR-6]MBT0566579.1 sulfite exporter TauE/SafE family protein [Williamsia sp. CHRR-6]
MSVLDLVFLTVAGFGAGLVGYVTGLASVVSYPALLLVGLSPLAANVTNTVALVAVGVGSTAKAGRSLDLSNRRWVVLATVSILGGVVGAVALLVAPASSFESVVPYLVALASAALMAQPLLRRLAGHRELPVPFAIGVFALSVYGGYFGAGAGVMFLAVALVFSGAPLWQSTLLKSVLLGLSNGVAAVIFLCTGPVHLPAAVAMGVGCLLGGFVGPPVVARLPAGPLRVVIAVAGVGLAIWLAVR